MDHYGLNEELIRSINDASEKDEVIRDFLINLVFEEAEHPDRWWWNRTYREKVEDHVKRWKGNDKN